MQVLKLFFFELSSCGVAQMVAESESPLLAHKGHGDEGVLAVLERFSD